MHIVTIALAGLVYQPPLTALRVAVRPHRMLAEVAKPREVEECMVDAESPEELAACLDDTSSTPFTLEKRGDGFDDVRDLLTGAKKDREKPWKEVNEDYVQPAARLTKALAEELPLPSLPSLPSLAPGEKKRSLKELAVALATSALDSAVARKEAASAAEQCVVDAESEAEIRACIEPPGPGPEKSLAAGTPVIALLLAVPAFTLLTLYLLGTGQL